MEIILGMEFFQDTEIILDMEAKHLTLHRATIGRRKKIYRQVYNLYSYAIH